MFNFFVIGDVTTDHIIRLEDGRVVESVDRENGKVTLPYPVKIPLNTAPESIPGGNAYTVACALSKLQRKTGIYTIIGPDDQGKLIDSSLQGNGVDCSNVKVDEEQGTNSSTILSIAGDRVILTYHYTREYQLPQLPSTEYVYLTSVGEDDVPLFRQVMESKSASDFKLVFSPGSLQLKESYSEIQPMVENCDILILNKEEAITLTQLPENSSDEDVIRGLERLGVKHCVVTKSHKGAVAISNGEIIRVGALKVEVVDTTGAGDTFSATVCAGLSYGRGMKESMEWGAINAAAVVCQVGSEGGMLTVAEIESRLSVERDNLIFID